MRKILLLASVVAASATLAIGTAQAGPLAFGGTAASLFGTDIETVREAGEGPRREDRRKDRRDDRRRAEAPALDSGALILAREAGEGPRREDRRKDRREDRRRAEADSFDASNIVLAREGGSRGRGRGRP